MTSCGPGVVVMVKASVTSSRCNRMRSQCETTLLVQTVYTDHFAELGSDLWTPHTRHTFGSSSETRTRAVNKPSCWLTASSLQTLSWSSICYKLITVIFQRLPGSIIKHWAGSHFLLTCVLSVNLLMGNIIILPSMHFKAFFLSQIACMWT